MTTPKAPPTPGPWTMHQKLSGSENDRGWDIQSGDVWIAEVSPCFWDDSGDASPEGLANARLIASAPAMYEALEKIAGGWVPSAAWDVPTTKELLTSVISELQDIARSALAAAAASGQGE